MKRLCCTAQFVAALVLSGCGTVDVFGRYDLPESPEVADAPYPRLIDTPAAAPAGTYTAAVPDPANGARAQTNLAASSVSANARAQSLAAPVLSEAERNRLRRTPRRRR